MAQWAVLPGGEREGLLSWALGVPHRLALAPPGSAAAAQSGLLRPPARALGAALLKRELAMGWEARQGPDGAPDWTGGALPQAVLKAVAGEAAASGLGAPLAEWLRAEAECVRELQPGGGSQALGLPLAAHKAAAAAAEFSFLPEAWRRSELVASNCLPAARRGEDAATDCLAAGRDGAGRERAAAAGPDAWTS